MQTFFGPPSLPPLSARQKTNGDTAVLKFIVNSMHPVSIVDDPNFRVLYPAVDSAYVPPCRQTMTARLLTLYHSEREHVNSLVSQQAAGVAVTLDGWTSAATQGYMCVTGHYLTAEFVLKSVCLDIMHLQGSHTADKIADEVITTVKTGLSVKVVSATTDNASNMKSATEKAAVSRIPCAAHTIQLSITGKMTKTLDAFVANLRKFVGHFSYSILARDSLVTVQQRVYPGRESHKCLQLVQDVPTRWNSTYLMIDRLLELKTALVVWQEENNIEYKISTEDWNKMKLLQLYLQPFFEVTTRLSAEKHTTLAMVHSFIRVLMKHLAKKVHHNDIQVCDITVIYCCLLTLTIDLQKYGDLSAFCEKIRKDLAKRWANIPNLALLSAILDPRFKSLPGYTPEQQQVAKQLLLDEYVIKAKELNVISASTATNSNNNNNSNNSSTPATKKQKGTSIFEDFFEESNAETRLKNSEVRFAELQMYKLQPPLELRGDPLLWWNQHRNQFPVIAEMARSVLCIPATSVPSERVFSDSGNIITEKRARTQPELAQALIYLYENQEVASY